MDAKSPISWIYGKWGARGVQLLVTGYLVYRYLRAFADSDFRTRLSGSQTQASFYGLDIPYIWITLGSPFIVLGLEIWAQRAAPGKLDKWLKYNTVVGCVSLVAAAIYMWIMCNVSDRTYGSDIISQYQDSLPVVYGAACLFAIVASVLVARTPARLAKRSTDGVVSSAHSS
jgi:hypothetical protein